MQHNRSTAAAWAAALLTPVLLTTVAASGDADWLVTRAGGRVETKGTWQTKGKLVVFTTADGKLSSLRLSDVDLEASRRATAEAAAAAQAPPPSTEPAKPREAKVVLTDANFKRTAPPSAPAGAGAAAPGEETKKEEGEAGATDKLAIASWERVPGPNGSVVITGTLRNDAPDDSIGSTVTVLLYDETGALLISGDAVLSSTVLPAGQTGSFRAEFPDVFSFAAVKFDARGMHVQSKSAEAPKEGGN